MLDDRKALLTGVGVGVALMYFLDPERGRRRRALVRDRLAHGARLTRDAAGGIRSAPLPDDVRRVLAGE